MATTQLLHGNCIDVLKTLPDNSIDSVVTDPPYGLEFMGKEFDSANGFRRSLNSADTGRENVFGRSSRTSPEYRITKAFQEFTEAWARECLRVLKPGGHLLAFGGSRTYHRMACAVEDAGFEIRDQIMWLYGCLSDDTELLINGQWVAYDKAREGDLTLAYDVLADKYSWEPIQRVYKYTISDIAYRLQSDSTDQVVSRNHRCLVEREGTLVSELAEDVARQFEARVPILEDVSGLLEALPVLHEGTSPNAVSEQQRPQAFRASRYTRTDLARITPFHYSGVVWCIQVPTGAFVARRNGKVFVTGNSGFPKSLNVGKALDKAGGESPYTQAVLLRCKRDSAGLSRLQVAEHVGCTESSVRDWEEGRSRAVGKPLEYIIPSQSYRAKLAALLGYSADERRVVGVADDRREDGTVFGLGHSGVLMEGGNTTAAKQFSGFGTALKPAHEPIVVARKPLIGTVVQNVLEHGTGAINIDGCRVEANGETPTGSGRRDSWRQLEGREDRQEWNGGNVTPPTGRWPANVVMDAEAGAALDAQTGDRPGCKSPSSAKPLSKFRPGQGAYQSQGPIYPDNGGASRFFYSAKAAKKERGEGNNHPTVKPLALMRWLVRLVTPPGGVTLDPLMGSGSTGVAALQEGFSFIGIERDQDYLAIAERRIGNEQNSSVRMA